MGQEGSSKIAVVVVGHRALVVDAIVSTLDREPDVDVRTVDVTAGATGAVPCGAVDVVVSDAGPVVDTDLRWALGAYRAHWVVRVRGDEPQELADALAGGARGLYTDRTTDTAVVGAVRQVASGNGWLAPELVMMLVEDYLPLYRRRRDARARLDGLGAGEIRLLALVADGRTNAEIASELHLAVSTVKDYVHRLRTRLGLTRAEVIALGMRAELTGGSEE